MADEKDTKTEETKEEKTEEETSPKETKEEEKTEDAPAEEKAEEVKEEAPAAEAEDAGESAGEDEANVEIPEKFQDIVEKIETMSVLDLNELVKLLEKKFGVSAVAAAAPAASGDAGADEEKSAFTVELTGAGSSKIGVIKAVKTGLGLGLKEAKDLVENVPATLKADMPKEEAEALKAAVEEAGGSVELK